MFEKEKILALVLSEPPKKADAIVLLEGDGYFRVKKAIQLYEEKWSKKIIVSGGIINYANGSYPNLLNFLLKKVPKKSIIIESKSKNTREQAVNVISIAKKNKWKKIILIASHYHQLRAFLTFLKVIEENKILIQIINAPATDLPWFEKNKWGRRIDLFSEEINKITLYKKHVISYKKAINYQYWKENKK